MNRLTKIIILITFYFTNGSIWAQPNPNYITGFLTDSTESGYVDIAADIILNSTKDVRTLKARGLTLNRVKALFVRDIPVSLLKPFKDSLEWLDVSGYLRLNKKIIFPSLKSINFYKDTHISNFATLAPNLEFLLLYSTDIIPILPPKLKTLNIRVLNNNWDGIIPKSILLSPSLRRLQLVRYDAKTDKDLFVFLPELDKPNTTLQSLCIKLDISNVENINKVVKFKNLKLLGVTFSELPPDSELKKLSYIPFILIYDNDIPVDKINLLAQKLGKRVFYSRDSGLTNQLLY